MGDDASFWVGQDEVFSTEEDAVFSIVNYRGISPVRNSPPPLGPPQDPRHSPSQGSWEGGVSYERGTTL